MRPVLALALAALLAGCSTPTRLGPPPSLIDQAAPVGFSPDIRIATADRPRYLADAPRFFSDVRQSARDGTVDVLSLSGGGSGGAFGAGALVGLTRSKRRPQFELVAGVSVGALIAPYAFLGPAWDGELTRAFSGNFAALRSPSTRSFIWSLLRPPRRDHPLKEAVDRIVTPDLVSAIAQETRHGRHLVVATTDLDRQETILWDIGRIAERGGAPASDLIKRVLLASISVPGVYPPVLIQVSDHGRVYDELHADGGITTSLFSGPLAGQIVSGAIPELRGANFYLLVNGQLAARPKQTPLQTSAILASTFSAAMTYKLREDVVASIDVARSTGMRLRITEIPAGYPQADFLDLSPGAMQSLFSFGERCAESGQLWITPEESLESNLERLLTESGQDCPVRQLRELDVKPSS